VQTSVKNNRSGRTGIAIGIRHRSCGHTEPGGASSSFAWMTLYITTSPLCHQATMQSVHYIACCTSRYQPGTKHTTVTHTAAANYVSSRQVADLARQVLAAAVSILFQPVREPVRVVLVRLALVPAGRLRLVLVRLALFPAGRVLPISRQLVGILIVSPTVLGLLVARVVKAGTLVVLLLLL
jgi:hypothetical protein